ncbi:MAG TPA: hypothetical protein DD490_28330 [Acidobacteria bacterium]|nr:hypothetical protein [Acidobacteriota bacterium]
MFARKQRIGLALALLLSLLPGSAVASPGASASHAPTLIEMLSHWLGLDGDIGPFWDPWGRSTLPPEDTRQDGELAIGWDPLGLTTVPPEDTKQEGDLGYGWDPWG